MVKAGEQIGRLALREEGNMWNAYYALPHTMKEAIPIGSIAIALVRGNPERKNGFIALMREAVNDLFEENMGLRPYSTGLVPAPESERGGNA